MKVAAIVDCEGYVISSQLFIREFAIASDFVTFSQEFGVNINQTELQTNDYNSINSAIKFKHGLPFPGPDLPINIDIKMFLKKLYEMTKTDEKIYWLTRNKYLQPILQQLGIPVLDSQLLIQLQCPSMPQLEKQYVRGYTCGAHMSKMQTGNTFSKRPYKCALRKVIAMWCWVKEGAQGRTMYETYLSDKLKKFSINWADAMETGVEKPK